MSEEWVPIVAIVGFVAFLGFVVFTVGQCDARAAEQMEACKVACGANGVHAYGQRGCECK